MLGQGVYKLVEVSRLTEIPQSSVRSWFKYRSDAVGRGPIFESDYQSVNGDFAVSFLDLIDVLVAGQFRQRYHVPMRIVRRAHTVLRTELNTEHPFCHSDLYTDGRRIFQFAASRLGEATLSDVISHQQFFLHIKEKLSHIEYSEITKLACRWRIAEGVVIDPSISVGKPTLENTGITTYVVTQQYYANARDSALVADLYAISEKAVVDAVYFEKRYGRRRVA